MTDVKIQRDQIVQSSSPDKVGELLRFKRELESKNHELTEAYHELKRTQEMLLQQEKLASIGQLAAGVAHEINNPIAYIQSNLRTLERYMKDISELFDVLFNMQKRENNTEIEADWHQVNEQVTSNDFEYILSDIKELIPQSLQGVERVRQIVTDLKSFSRADKAEKAIVDIHECINSALNIVWNEIKYRVTVNRDFSDVPPVECFPQQITQVFVNLLMNAGQAISKKGDIRITTRYRDEKVVIIVADTGDGISPENLLRIFDPFFTTKPVGKGTGLGLSIVYGIIQRHGGTIQPISTPGKGTEFRIELPLKCKEEEPV
ncbi:GHKL domain-containing protein [bacterium]|nr:GHKL domain-containing protein [bacterium]